MDGQMKRNIGSGLISTIPIMVGYMPSAIAFGLLAKNMGIGFKDTTLFSLIVYAGASQFMALDLITAGVSTGSIIIAAFLLNSRHFMMSASISLKLKDVKKPLLPIIGYGITDETFSLLSFLNRDLNASFVLVVTILSHLTWAGGTIVGYLVGEILPPSLQSSLSIALYAMFAALLFPQFKINKKILILSIITGVIYLVIFYLNIFAPGWDIVIGIIISSAIGLVILNKDEEVKSDG